MIDVTPLDFMGQGALLEPIDRNLHDAAVDYCQRELKDPVNLSKFNKVWVGRKDGQVFGVCGYVLRPDIPMMRATDAAVLKEMGRRLNSFFADNGCRGQSVFMYIGNEKPDQRCPDWRRTLIEFGAKSAQRVMFEVK